MKTPPGTGTKSCVAETPERPIFVSGAAGLDVDTASLTGGADAPPGTDRVPHRTASV